MLNAGDGAAVVVDTGPDPPAMDACLDRLHVDALPVVVLTHFHADHVDGLPAVLRGRRVGEVEVTATEDPAYGAVEVHRWAAAVGVPVRVPSYGEVRRVGDLTWQVIGPVSSAPGGGRGEEGSVANNASLVLLVRGARRAAAAGRRHGARGPAAPRRVAAGAAGRRPQGAAPREPLPGPRPARRRSARGWRWCRWAGTTTTGTPPGARSRCCVAPACGSSAPTRTVTSPSRCATDGWGCSAGAAGGTDRRRPVRRARRRR